MRLLLLKDTFEWDTHKLPADAGDYYGWNVLASPDAVNNAGKVIKATKTRNCQSAQINGPCDATMFAEIKRRIISAVEKQTKQLHNFVP